MSSAILQEDRFADFQESRFQVAKRSDMFSVDMKVLRFAVAQESRFHACNRSHMASAALQIGRFADC